MTTIDISRYADLAQELRLGHDVILTDHGMTLGKAHPVSHELSREQNIPREQGAWLTDLAAFRASLGVQPGSNAVLDMRTEDER
jgi:hypothetical protein